MSSIITFLMKNKKIAIIVGVILAVVGVFAAGALRNRNKD